MKGKKWLGVTLRRLIVMPMVVVMIFGLIACNSSTTQDEANAAAVKAAVTALTWDAIRNGNTTADSVTTALTLPITGADGVVISWASDKADVISTEGIVTRPDYTSGDANVRLTATLTKSTKSDAKTFDVTVKKLPMSDSEAVTLAKAALTWESIKGSNTEMTDVKFQLVLPDVGLNNVAIAWSSENAAISDTGAITIPRPDDGGVDTGGILTATLTRGNATAQTVEFELTVVARDVSPDEKVALALAGMTWAVINKDGVNTSQSAVKSDLNLPTTANNGVSVTWSLLAGADAKYLNVVTGSISRPSISEGDKQIGLVASFMLEGATTQTKGFDLTILTGIPAGYATPSVQADALAAYERHGEHTDVSINWATNPDNTGIVTANNVIKMTGTGDWRDLYFTAPVKAHIDEQRTGGYGYTHARVQVFVTGTEAGANYNLWMCNGWLYSTAAASPLTVGRWEQIDIPLGTANKEFINSTQFLQAGFIRDDTWTTAGAISAVYLNQIEFIRVATPSVTTQNEDGYQTNTFAKVEVITFNISGTGVPPSGFKLNIYNSDNAFVKALTFTEGVAVWSPETEHTVGNYYAVLEADGYFLTNAETEYAFEIVHNFPAVIQPPAAQVGKVAGNALTITPTVAVKKGEDVIGEAAIKTVSYKYAADNAVEAISASATTYTPSSSGTLTVVYESEDAVSDLSYTVNVGKAWTTGGMTPVGRDVGNMFKATGGTTTAALNPDSTGDIKDEYVLKYIPTTNGWDTNIAFSDDAIAHILSQKGASTAFKVFVYAECTDNSALWRFWRKDVAGTSLTAWTAIPQPVSPWLEWDVWPDSGAFSYLQWHEVEIKLPADNSNFMQLDYDFTSAGRINAVYFTGFTFV